MSNKWLVLGASPSAPDFYKIPDVDFITSAGDAILLCRPDWYFVNERRSLDLHKQERAEARAKGTRVVIQRSFRKLIKYHDDSNFCFPYDDCIEDFSYGSIWRSHEYWTPGRYSQSSSGCLALQWAVNHGATEVHMVGMEGYTGGVDYFTGTKGSELGARWTHESYGPLVQRIIETSPDIQFTMYGEPLYQLKAENLTFYGRPNPAPVLNRGLSLKE